MILRCVLHESKEMDHWETMLAIVEFVINKSPAQSTGYMPFDLNYIYHPCTLVDILRDSEVTAIENVN